MRPRIMPVLVLALVTVALAAGVAIAEETGEVTYSSGSEECYVCHGVDAVSGVRVVDFGVGAVDYTRCATCHAAINTSQHWHNPRFARCRDCHAVMLPIIADLTQSFTSTFVDPVYGTFKTSVSLGSSASALHAAHAGTGWVDSLVFKAGSTAECRSCHAPAVCSACHSDTVPHGDHAVSAYPGVSYVQATGTSTTTEPSTCVNSACHDIAKAATDEFIPQCATCHFSFDEHYGAERHTSSWAPMSGCSDGGCHDASGDLMTIHEEHRTVEEGEFGCAGCHANVLYADEIAAGLTGCDDCHEIHGDVSVIHTAVDSAGCVDCHETGDTLALHVAADGSADCALCHRAPAGRIDWSTVTIECASCHGSLVPVEEEHYPAASHESVTERGCPKCHSMDLKTEHAKYAVGCVQCHETYVNAFVSPWDQTCDACHPVRHKDRTSGGGMCR
ncbi:MAG TPA: hypothetical protein ENN10_04050 [Actinobacteria bacterium]|nr:hypothetical protein [Actinomycetota bacterium]